MPPRKKVAATADGTDAAKPAAPTRSSGRTRAPSAKAVAVAAAAKPAAAKTAAKAKTATAKNTGKGKGKRAREESDDEEGADADAKDEEDDTKDEVKKPKNKRAKKDTVPAADAPVKDEDADMDNADAKEDKTKDADTDAKAKGKAKKPASKPASKKTKEAADLPQKMVTVVKRGAAPVDALSGMVDTHAVLVTPESVWDAMLNQTDLGKNANKFYVLQLLHPIGNTNSCILFTRWGRVGENGQSQKKGPWPAAMAVNEFKKQFKAKAGVDWEHRVGMAPRKGKYVWLERSYDDEEESKKAKGSGSSSSKDDEEEEKIPDSTLPPEIQTLCKLIFNSSLIDAHLSSMNYDANKLPLGKLAKSTILAGFAALKTLSEVIAQPNGDTVKSFGNYRQAVQDLTSQYYSIIPHVFGRDRPPVIDSIERLKKELELVDALGDMEVASKLIATTIPRDASGRPVNPLDGHFRSLQLSSMEPVARTSAEFAALAAYTRDTHGSTHRHYGVDVLHAFRVEREDETKAWMDAGYGNLPDGERLLLWHGSRTTNFAGILKQGLRIAPPEAPVTGYMFGKGVYFADMMSKSANYCHAYLSDNTGLLLLCEVAAKPFYEQYQANYSASEDCKKAGARATKGIGRSAPGEWQDAGLALAHPGLRGCHMPKGPAADVPDPKAYLQYNEYIVYDTSQIRLRYLLMVKMA
ncbi:poly polymerase catalytic domain-containing protein [Trametes polyzona]|nr:poly polymerase catalytic domain-containing protein [Trametes polyzona]